MGQGEKRMRAIAVRLSQSDLRLLDALSRVLTAAGDGVIRYTRSDVIRLAVRRLAEKHLPRPQSNADA